MCGTINEMLSLYNTGPKAVKHKDMKISCKQVVT